MQTTADMPCEALQAVWCRNNGLKMKDVSEPSRGPVALQQKVNFTEKWQDEQRFPVHH